MHLYLRVKIKGSCDFLSFIIFITIHCILLIVIVLHIKVVWRRVLPYDPSIPYGGAILFLYLAFVVIWHVSVLLFQPPRPIARGFLCLDFLFLFPSKLILLIEAL